MPMYLKRFSYTRETSARLVQESRGSQRCRQAVHRIGRRKTARLLGRVWRSRWLQPVGGARQSFDRGYRYRHHYVRRPELLSYNRSTNGRRDTRHTEKSFLDRLSPAGQMSAAGSVHGDSGWRDARQHPGACGASPRQSLRAPNERCSGQTLSDAASRNGSNVLAAELRR